MSNLPNEPVLYCEHVGCPNGHTTRSGLCEACARVVFDRLTARVMRAEHHIAMVKLERDDMAIRGDRLKEERDTLRAWNFPVLAWLGRWRDHLPPEAVVCLQDICDIPKDTP